MPRYLESLIAWTGIFVGSLLWNVFFGDGLQDDDFAEAFTVALIAAAIQWGFSSLNRRAWK